ncbi:MAG TPA: hypothetical protein DIC42_06105 [Holosporales bacterium]|nr:hypothetical protein [Holosporales bacterium]
MSSKKRFFLVYVSLLALANSVHANDGANGAAGVIQALGDIIGKFAPNKDDKDNGMQGGLMNLGGFGQQGMMQNGVQPVNFQGIPVMNQGSGFNGQMGNYNNSMGGFGGQQQMLGANGQQAFNPMTGQPASFQQGMNPGGAMAGFSAQQQMPGTPMIIDGQPVIDPSTGQSVLVPQPGTMNPGSPMIGANGQPIINPTTGQPVLVPQPGMQQNGMGGVFAGPIDESVLANPTLNPQLYEQIMAEAQKDPKLVDALARVKEELNEEDAKLVRATLLKPILLRMNLSQAQEAQMLQAQQMQQQQAMSQASAAARFAEQQRIRTIEAEIARLEQENNQIIANLKRQGVSQEEINTIVSKSRQDGARIAGNANPLAGMPQMPNAMNNPAFGTPPEIDPNAITPLGVAQPQAGGLPAFPGTFEPQPQAGGLPAFPGMGEPQPQAVELPAFPELGEPQPQSGGLPAFPGMGEPEPQADGLPQMPF